MIIYNKFDNYFVFSADRQTFLGFEMIANLRDTSPLNNKVRQIYFISNGIFCFHFLACPAGWATNKVYCYYIDVTRTPNRNVSRKSARVWEQTSLRSSRPEKGTSF